MSLTVKLKQFQIGKTKGEKIAKIDFRGTTQCTAILEDTGELIIVDEVGNFNIPTPFEMEKAPEGQNLNINVVREYEELINTMRNQLDLYEEEHNKLKEELNDLMSENRSLNQKLYFEFNRRIEDDQIPKIMESEMVINLRNQLDLSKKEKQKTFELYQASTKLIEKLEEEIRNREKYQVTAMGLKIEDPSFNHIQLKLKSVEERLETEISSREQLESDNVKYQTEIAKLKLNLDSNKDAIEDLKEKDRKWKDRYSKMEQDYTLLNATLECVAKSRNDLENKIDSYNKKIQELSASYNEAKSKVAEALDLVERAVSERDASLLREADLCAENSKLKLCINHVIEEAGKKVSEELEEMRKKYEAYIHNIMKEVPEIKSKLENKTMELKKMTLKFKKLEKSSSAKLDKEKISLIKGSETEITMLENQLDHTYKEMERAKIRNEELEEERARMEDVLSELGNRHETLLRSKEMEERRMEQDIKALREQLLRKIEDLAESSKRAEFFLSQIQELQAEKKSLSKLAENWSSERSKLKKALEIRTSQVGELEEHVESLKSMNEKWKSEIKGMTEEFESRIREVKKECSSLKKRNREVVKELEAARKAISIIDKIFEWPLSRPVQLHESLQITLCTHNKYFSSKTIGYYGLVLQAVVQDGRVAVCDTLVDANNKPIPVTVDFETSYTPPKDVPVSDVMAESFEDDQQMLIDIEQNIANLEKSLTSDRRGSWESHERGDGKSSSKSFFMRRADSFSTPERSPVADRKSSRSSALRTVRSLMRLGKYKSKDFDNEEKDKLLKDGQGSGSVGLPQTPQTMESSSVPESLAGSITSLESMEESEQCCTPNKKKRLKQTVASVTNSVLKSQDFQICITVIEARQLAGLNMDPVVCVQVGDQKKYTSVKESTNCPYYNEYFVFDFRMPAIMLLDKIITLSVLQSRKFMRSGTIVGSFKIDVKTLYDAPDHQFYHKWALLTDPDDTIGGPKGYLKCDMSVIGKGDSVKIPPKSEKDEDDIEANLLLPPGVPVERQRARFIVKIYRADGLPKMNSSLMANVKKAFTGEVQDLVNPYVQVSFAGLSGKTSVKKHNYAPVWNEQIVFMDMFPPLCQRIKIQLRDSDPVNRTVIGTHFIDLKSISNDGEKGFLPTFGPTFVHLYGSTRDYHLIDEHANLNTGLGEGVSYRARLLLAIRTEITDNIDILQHDVEVEPIYPVQEASYGKNDEFFLFASILDASMIDKKITDKPILFELSMGNAGNALDGQNETYHCSADSESEDNLEMVTTETSSCHSTTSPAKPMTHDKLYYFLPYWENKPCMHVNSVWPDYRRRMYNSNMISKIVDKMEEALSEVHSFMEAEDSNAEKALKSLLEELSVACTRYVNNTKGTSTGAGTGKTKLDKERMKLCSREIEHMATTSRNLKALVTKSTLKERYKTACTYLQKLKFLEDEPQHSLPDVFIWAISGNKRMAYHRLPARDIIYSLVDDECGRECGKVQTMFLKLPGRKSMGPGGWAIQIKLKIYMWLGLLQHRKNFLDGLPKGYEMTTVIRNAERPHAMPPTVIHYLEKHTFQLRAHMYQARSLIGSDASGLSDPFARVIIEEYCRTTQVIDETLSPTWDELLIFDEIVIWGTREDIKRDPPTILIEVFDQDKVGKSEFIGRAMAKPHVKLEEEEYSEPEFPPPLEWYEIQRGPDHAGELLACFELLEYSPKSKDLPLLPLPKSTETALQGSVIDIDVGPVLPVPRGIRPTLAKYRIEVLFWGLRDLKRIHFLTVDKPRVDIECAGHILSSTIIQNAKKNPNFCSPVKFIDVELPEQELYRPPLTIRTVDCRSFGRYTLVGTHMINSIHKYMFVPATKKERDTKCRQNQLQQLQGEGKPKSDGAAARQYFDDDTAEDSPLLPRETTITLGYGTTCLSSKKDPRVDVSKKRKKDSTDDVEEDEGNRDWWTKYFMSVEAMIEESKESKKESAAMQNQPNGSVVSEDSEGQKKKDTGTPGERSDRKRTLKGATSAIRFVTKLSPKNGRNKAEALKKALIKLYPNELENQSDYNGFKEWLQTFELYRGKKTGDELEDENRVVGTFKGAIKVYKLPLPKDLEDHTVMGFDPQYGFFQGLPSNEPIHVLVRVYVVKANDLHPMDLNGKADPYIVLQLGSKRISDKDNYVSKQLNPVFGKCFEIEATFPQDSLLTIQILDWDLVGSDEMIGETKIDLENRFYSRHRATCGIAQKYDDFGYNQWRDPMKPTQILAKLCKDGKVEPPAYFNGKVKVGRHLFTVKQESADCTVYAKGMEEHMALAVLHKWHEFPRIGCQLVPEHIETRPLYNPEKPGIEQGKLEMWVDMFPMDMPLPGPPLDISPRKPKSYELRIIIWNTDDVVLEDDAFFTGEKMSDIYVKGWLKGPEDCQYTDIHYRSLTGEGNFNWRFIYPFDYLVAEEKIVISRKESLFSWDETECKIPARLELQVWDADHFSADDFLGAITLDLNRFPRGAKSSKLCTLNMLKTDGSVPMVNIFKQKRLKGWWPFYIKKENDEMELTGKVEAEIHLLTKEEAERNPAGCGRNEPDPLEKPNRPDASFMWFLNPLKSIRYVIWHNYKWMILKFFIVLALAVIFLLFFYAIPGYTVKKILGA